MAETPTYDPNIEALGYEQAALARKHGAEGLAQFYAHFEGAPEAEAQEQLEAQQEFVKEVVTESGSRLIVSARKRKGAQRAQGAPAPREQVAEDIETVVVGSAVEEIIEESKPGKAKDTNKKVGKLLETVESDEADEQKLGAGEKLDEETLYRRHAMRIKDKIAHSEGAKEAFAQGGDEAFVKYIEEQFATNKHLQKIAKRMKYYEDIHAHAKSKVQAEAHKAGKDVVPYTGAPEGTSANIVPREPKAIEARKESAEAKGFADDRRLPKDLAYELAYAMKDYGDLAAKRERSTITPKLTEKKLEEARVALESIRDKVRGWTTEQLRENGLTEGEIIALERLDDKTDARLVNLDIKINAERLATPQGMFKESRTKFLNWWARQGNGEKAFSKQNIIGKLKKGGVMAIIGAPVGIAAGAAGVALLGPVAGAVLAAGAARGVARGLMRGRIDKAAEGMTLAERNFNSRVAEQNTAIDAAYDKLDSYVAMNEQAVFDGVRRPNVTESSQAGVEANVRRNRRRAMASVAIGAVAGGVAAEFAGDLFGGHGPSNKPEAGRGGGNHHGGKNHGGRNHGPKPEQGGVVNVEAGSGEIREIQEYANAHGLNIDGQRATEIFNKLHAEHGNDIIDLRGPGANTYNIGGNPNNPGLLHPDARAHWFPGIEEEILKEARK